MRTVSSLIAVLALVMQTPTLDSLNGNKRALLVFAPSAQDSAFRRQGSIDSEHRSDLEERDVVVLQQLGTDASADQARLRKRFHIAATEFTVILIGKDGGEKLRQHMPIEAAALNAVIDAMPMRQDEMRRRKPR